jgi:hypothetical protein
MKLPGGTRHLPLSDLRGPPERRIVPLRIGPQCPECNSSSTYWRRHGDRRSYKCDRHGHRFGIYAPIHDTSESPVEGCECYRCTPDCNSWVEDSSWAEESK